MLNVPHTNADIDENIRIKGILVDEVTQPKNDGSKGSGLYKIPFELNREPDHEWKELFIAAWNHPSQFTQMHRPGISSVIGNKIILDGTTIEEVESYHKNTLKLAVETANTTYISNQRRKKQVEDQAKNQAEVHKQNINNISKRINFD